MRSLLPCPLALAALCCLGLPAPLEGQDTASAPATEPSEDPFSASWRPPEPPSEAEVARRVDALLRTLRARSRGPGRLPALYRLAEAATAEVPGAALQALRRAARAKWLPPASRWLAGWLAQGLAWRHGAEREAVQWQQRAGLVDDWWVVGPFDDEGKRGLERPEGPEQRASEPPDPADTFEGKGRSVQWRRWSPEDEILRAARGGYVNLDEALWPREAVCGYASTTVDLSSAGDVELWFGHGGAARLWWNGVLVLDAPRYRNRAAPDRLAVRVRARAGANRILVKNCVQRHAWGFWLRLARNGGLPLTDFRLDPTDRRPARETAERVRARPLATDFSNLEGAADASEAQERTPAPALRAYLALSRFRNPDDHSSPRFPILAERLAERSGDVEDLLRASRMARTRADALQWWRRAWRRAPLDPTVRLRGAELLERGPEDAPPLPRYLAILTDAPEAARTVRWQAARAAARLLQRAELPRLALHTLHEEARRQGRLGTVEGLLSLADALEAAQDAPRAEAFRREALARMPNDATPLRALIGAAVARADEGNALPLIRRLARAEPNAWTHRRIAEWLERLGRPIDAWHALERALRRAPDDPALHRAMGRLALALGRRRQARSAFQRALVLRPQQPDLRERLAWMASSTAAPIETPIHPGEAHAADRRTLLDRRVEHAEHPATVLQDLTVTEIHPNGLGSTFRQIAVQIHDEAAARDWRSHAIPYTPGWQRVQVLQARVYRGGRTLRARQTLEQEVGEASWRVYYDRRLRIVLLPELRPGDVLELRYRVDDVAHRNVFADYFGDLHVLQREVPVRHAEYLLISPKRRSLAFRSGGPVPLRHTRRFEGERRIDRWVGEELPAVISEPLMPGPTETTAHVHVSTYQRWEDVARWYWGLIEDQLVLDDRLRQVAREALRKAPNLERRVERLYEWVLEHTRYVAMEFGIHGYKPYRVTDVARRGFGDCKDKASLLYALLREANVEAHIVLLRTRRNGAVAPEPASLAVFDHAIVYVPALDLYLDGTAEHSGPGELPPMDQGAMVLHVAPGVGQLRTTPILPATRHLEAERWDLRVARDGSAKGRVTLHWEGTAAPIWRRELEAEGTRLQRIERTLQRRFPGLRVERLRMQGAMTRTRPVEVEAEARVPHLAQRAESTLEVPMWAGESLLEAFASSPRRHHALELVPRRTLHRTLRIRPESGLRVRALPRQGRPVRIDSPFGRFEARFQREGDVVVMNLQITLEAERVPVERYPAFRDWLRAVEHATRAPLVLEVRP